MGSAEEFREMLQFIEDHNIRPVIDQVFPLSQYEKAFKRVENADQFGKIGFKLINTKRTNLMLRPLYMCGLRFNVS